MLWPETVPVSGKKLYHDLYPSCMQALKQALAEDPSLLATCLASLDATEVSEGR